MEIDLEKYAGHTQGPWEISSEGGVCGGGYIIAEMWGGYKECTANHALIADSPALLAEVVRLREEVEFLRGVADGARQNAAEKLAEADQLRAEPSEALIKLRALVDGLDATYWSSWQSTGHFSDALEAAREFLAKHGGGK